MFEKMEAVSLSLVLYLVFAILLVVGYLAQIRKG
jgi:hypothetical protein